MSDKDEVLAKSKKPVLFPRRVGTGNVVTIPEENLDPFDRKPRRQILVDVYTMRGADGRIYFKIERRLE